MTRAESVPLKSLSSYVIGGPARYFFDVGGADELRDATVFARENNFSFFILGGGTNLLVSDEGFPGVVIRPNITSITRAGERVEVGVGTLIRDLLTFAVAHGLSGLEWAGGLPGMVGGAVRGNAGAFGGEIKDVVAEVESFDTASGTLRRRTNAECDFGYRTSVFRRQSGKEIITRVIMRLKRGDSTAIQRAIEEKIQYRLLRHPMEHPNIGSIFKNVDWNAIPKEMQSRCGAVLKSDPFPVVPTAFLIAETGLKGVSFGGAMISPKHPNFIVNVLHASSRDVEELIRLVKREVKREFGVALEEEVERVGFA